MSLKFIVVLVTCSLYCTYLSSLSFSSCSDFYRIIVIIILMLCSTMTKASLDSQFATRRNNVNARTQQQ